MKEKVKRFKNYVTRKYSALFEFLASESDDLKRTACKSFLIIGGLIILAVIVYLIVKYALAPLTVFGVLLLLFLWDNGYFDQKSSASTYVSPEIARDLLCRVLSDHGHAIDLDSPENVTDITPVLYPVVQTESGQSFYRFIVRTDIDFDGDYRKLQENLHVLIGQRLQAGVPNIPVPFYKDAPTYCVFRAGKDLNHHGYAYIDIVPVLDEKSYQFACEKIRTMQQSKHHISSSSDKEF